MIPVRELQPVAARLPEEVFLERYPHPALLVNPDPHEEPSEGELEEGTRTLRKAGSSTEDWLSRTHADDELSPASLLAADLLQPGNTAPLPSDLQALQEVQRVAFVVKREGNPFPHMITIGRVPNNDVVFVFPTISKVHAYLHRDTEGAWWLYDQRSTNGTWVGGARLEPGGKAPVDDGTWINLGPSLGIKFFSPAALYGYLRGLEGRASTSSGSGVSRRP